LQREIVVERRGVPSRLIRSLLSRRVGAFLSCGEDGLLVLGGAGAADPCLLGGAEVFFFLAFFVTVAQVGAGTEGIGFKGGGAGGVGAEVDSGFGVRVGEGGAPLSEVSILKSHH
jgi:hypothetical protein